MANIALYDSSGKNLGLTTLGIDIAAKESSPRTYSHAVRVILQNGRQGTVGCKSRGEVSFANRKPWKQKGTGRARAGSARSPLWRSGGVAFGPQKRTRKLAINKKQKGLVLNNILSNVLEKKSVYCFDHQFDNKQGPSTKLAYNLLKNIGLENKKIVVFVPFSDSITGISFRNITNVNVLFFNEPNVYNLSNSDCWVFFKKDITLFEEMVAKWN